MEKARFARPLSLSVAATIALAAVWFHAQARADDEQRLAPPQSAVILEISGKIARTNAPKRALFDRVMLEALGTATVRTTTPWTDGTPEFRGVLGRDLLNRVGAQGKTVRAIALNDYVIDIPIDDFREYPVVLALEMNGSRLEVRDKGPIWIVYPLDQFEALEHRNTERKMVWQLRELQIR